MLYKIIWVYQFLDGITEWVKKIEKKMKDELEKLPSPMTFFFSLGSESNSEAWKYLEGLNND